VAVRFDALRRRHALLRVDEVLVGSRAVGEPIAYWDEHGRDLARVHPTSDPGALQVMAEQVVHHPAEEWRVGDDNGTIFTILRYDPADHPSYVTVDEDAEPLGTFLCEGGLLHEHVVVRDETSAPVATMRTRHHEHELRALHGPPLATCERVAEHYDDDPLQEIWRLRIETDDDLLDRRVLLAAPLVCALTSHPKRHLDPQCTIAAVLLLTVPPVGAAMLIVEETIDGLYWLRRRLD
jgi:hypothetical protein